MSVFCPDGYMPTQEAIARAAEFWFSEKFTALERAAERQWETKAENSFEAAARALSQLPEIPDPLRHEFCEIVNQTVHRLRNLLHQSKLTAYYFGGPFGGGRRAVPSSFWATTEANGAMESGTYWPFGRPTYWHESRPNYPLFLVQSELDRLLTEPRVKKRPLPKAKNAELLAALRKLDDLPNRPAQLETLRNMPEFREFTITNALFREASRQAPRDPGRKSRRKS